MTCPAAFTYPRPAACHPERCVETSPHSQIVQESPYDWLIVECDLCATVRQRPPVPRAGCSGAVCLRPASPPTTPSQVCDTE